MLTLEDKVDIMQGAFIYNPATNEITPNNDSTVYKARLNSRTQRPQMRPVQNRAITTVKPT